MGSNNNNVLTTRTAITITTTTERTDLMVLTRDEVRAHRLAVNLDNPNSLALTDIVDLVHNNNLMSNRNNTAPAPAQYRAAGITLPLVPSIADSIAPMSAKMARFSANDDVDDATESTHLQPEELPSDSAPVAEPMDVDDKSDSDNSVLSLIMTEPLEDPNLPWDSYDYIHRPTADGHINFWGHSITEINRTVGMASMMMPDFGLNQASKLSNLVARLEWHSADKESIWVLDNLTNLHFLVPYFMLRSDGHPGTIVAMFTNSTIIRWNEINLDLPVLPFAECWPEAHPIWQWEDRLKKPYSPVDLRKFMTEEQLEGMPRFTPTASYPPPALPITSHPLQTPSDELPPHVVFANERDVAKKIKPGGSLDPSHPYQNSDPDFPAESVVLMVPDTTNNAEAGPGPRTIEQQQSVPYEVIVHPPPGSVDRLTEEEEDWIYNDIIRNSQFVRATTSLGWGHRSTEPTLPTNPIPSFKDITLTVPPPSPELELPPLEPILEDEPALESNPGDSMTDLPPLPESGTSSASSAQEGEPVPDTLHAAALRFATKPPSGSTQNKKSAMKNLAPKEAIMQRTSIRPKNYDRQVPMTYVVRCRVNGAECCALIDTGSHGDFISTTLADQLQLHLEQLEKPITCQLAATGSKATIQHRATVLFEHQDISEHRTFDVFNVDTYDLILGTPFLYQHKVVMAFNPNSLVIGSAASAAVPPVDLQEVSSMRIKIQGSESDALADEIAQRRQHLQEAAADLCKSAEETPLPPFRAINHSIVLKDPDLVYKWIPSRCPEAMRGLWDTKKNNYLSSGRWRFATGRNSLPMLILKKPDPTKTKPLRIRTVVDKQMMNANTVKHASPLPNMETILYDVLRHPYRSVIDGRDAFEQIRVHPDCVPLTLFNTPDGTMVSEVMQQGDLNAPSTYQSLLNHILGPHIGVFLHVYLDDIVIFSDTPEEHERHVKLVLDILQKEKLYLTSQDKLQFFAEEMQLLGHTIDAKGIKMDPHKVNTVLNWKTPVTKTQLSGFLGSVGFLVPDCRGVRIPMGTLTPLTGSSRPWKWTETEQRAFEQIKSIVHNYREHRRVAIDYSSTGPINLVCDASLTGAGGMISQGENIDTAGVVAFWSAKFDHTQMNYPVHKREMLAIVESLKRFRHLLTGAKFRVFTDHKPLKHMQTQKDLSARQVRWLDVINKFDFSVHYIPGETNIVANALSRMYSEEPKDVMRSHSEHIVEPDYTDEHANVFRLASIEPSPYTTIATGPSVPAQIQLVADKAEKRKARMPAPSDRITRTASNSLPQCIDNESGRVAVMPMTEQARLAIDRPKTVRKKVSKRKETENAISTEVVLVRPPIEAPPASSAPAPVSSPNPLPPPSTPFVLGVLPYDQPRDELLVDEPMAGRPE